MKKDVNLILAICCYNRLDYLAQLLNSFIKYRNIEYNYKIFIHNDKLEDHETKMLLDRYNYKLEYIYIESNRQGVHVAKNKLLNLSFKEQFDYLFLVEDDIYIKDFGFEDCYIKAIEKSKYQYLCFYDQNWEKSHTNRIVIKENLNIISYGNALQSQGAFCVMTKEVIKKIGYYDVQTMGFRGIGHLDYATRASKEGLNCQETFFDAINSSNFIGMQKENYKHSLSDKDVLENRMKQHVKLNVLRNRKHNYIIYNI